MAFFELTATEIRNVEHVTFADARVRERQDLQRLLRSRIEIVAPDVMVIAEEFGDWVDSRRRIDLLGLDRDANLVVIELKRTEDGGHMELQALRYASMVSTMTFDQLVDAHSTYLRRLGLQDDARKAILDFLPDSGKESFGQDVRIVLVSAEFSKELTTAVMWLNDQGLDITCVRTQLYRLDGRLLLDVQQIIPWPEVADYQVRIREKAQRERQERKEDRVTGKGVEYREFFQALIDELREKHRFTNARAGLPQNWYTFTAGTKGFGYSISFTQGGRIRSELYIDGGDADWNLQTLRGLRAEESAIQEEFDEPLVWEELATKRACRVACYRTGSIGDSPEARVQLQGWAIQQLLTFKRVFGPRISRLQLAVTEPEAPLVP